MIYIFTALFAEARPLIRQLGLKRVRNGYPFEEYEDEEHRFHLALTGTGSVSAAAVVGGVCAACHVTERDFLCNVGTCAGRRQEKAFLIHRIVEAETGRTFYPDILYRHPFTECSAVTVSRPLSSGLPAQDTCSAGACGLDEAVYDMEAAGFYQAGSRFVGPHRIAVIKVVSDDGRGQAVTAERLETVMAEASPEIVSWIGQLGEILAAESDRIVRFSSEEEEALERLCQDMHCSETMRASVRQHFFYVKLSCGGIASVLEKIYAEGMLPCRDKREGKRCFDAIKQGLL